MSERRVKKFIEGGGDITVISENFTPGLKKFAEQGKIKIISERISEKNIEKWLKGSFLISLTTDNEDLNFKIANIAKSKGILINLAHQSDLSDVLIPASLQKDDFLIAVSTRGKSPLLAKKLKQRISKLISEEDVLWLRVQTHARERIKKEIEDQKKREEFLNSLLNNEQLAKIIKNLEIDKAKELTNSLISNLKEKDKDR